VIAPLLLVTGGLRPAQVSGTTLATVLLISIVGSGVYASLGHLNLGMAWPIAAGSVAGSVIGALMARRLSIGLMLACFLLILPYFVLKEMFPTLAAPALPPSYGMLVVLGFSTGLLSGLLGISGASLVVPSLVAFFLIDHHAAQGIAMSVALADSVAGSLTHARGKNVNYRAVLHMAVPAVAAAVGGALLSSVLPSSVLRDLFVLFMVAIWGILLVRMIKVYAVRRWLSLGHAGTAVAGPARGHRDGPPSGESSPAARFNPRRALNAGNLMNAMLVFVPLAVLSHELGASPAAVFGCAALACVALSYRLGRPPRPWGPAWVPWPGDCSTPPSATPRS
jgi:uncharacterized membrane protein YfcA